MNLKPENETMMTRYKLICFNDESAAINNSLANVTVNNILNELHLENSS